MATAKKVKPAAKKTPATTAVPAEANLGKIGFSKLTPWKDNVRKTGATDDIGELEASILSVGLINPMTVMKNKDKYTVIAGNRRLLAITNLVKAGNLPKNYEVSCHVFDENIDPTELSLAENVIRQNMHPADQAEAFAYLREKGLSESDIGARFGVTDAIVKKRLALASVSPKIIKALRDGKIGLEHAQAFTVTDDQKAQEKVFKDMDVDLDTRAPQIRNALTQQDVRATDKLSRFVGLAAYQAAGGQVKRDLFDECDENIFLTDSKLLNELALEKLNQTAETVKAEGWNWVKIMPDGIGWDDTKQFDVASHKTVALSKSDQVDYKAFSKEYDRLDNLDFDKQADDHDDRVDELRYKLDRLDEKKKTWPDKVKATAGAMIGLDSEGRIEIVRGLVEKKQAKALKSAEKKAAKNKPGAKAGEEAADEGMSRALLEDLSNHRSLALAASLAQNSNAAIRALTYTLALPILYSVDFGFPMDPCIKVEGIQVYKKFGDKAGLYKGLTGLLKFRNNWLDKTPEKDADFWGWCMHDAEWQTILDLLSFCTALSLDDMSVGGSSRPHATSLWCEMKVDMSQWYSATGENFFSRLGKPQLFSVIKELRGEAVTPAEQKLTKAGLADIASGLAGKKADEGKPYLPLVLRMPQGETQSEEKKEAA